MKSAVKVITFLTLLGAVLAHAQQYTVPYFEHVIIIVQENRTPDNLFGAAARIPYPSTLPPLNAASYDLKLPPPQTPGGGGQPIPISSCLGSCFDPGHGSGDWQAQDGLLNGKGYSPHANSPGFTNSCPLATGGCNAKVCFTCNAQLMVPPNYPQETYVDPTYDAGQANFGTNPPIYPYFDIAAKYGFANYFFQTNQGPSEPAHDFLFGGTSAPAGSSTQTWFGTFYQDFVYNNYNNTVTGDTRGDCYYNSNQTVPFIFPNAQYTNQQFPNGVTEPPCFDHLTLADLLTSNGKTWKYYTTKYYDYWTAPSRIAHICYGSGATQGNFPYECDLNAGFTANVVKPPEAFFMDVTLGGTNLPGGDSHGGCLLPNVTWIIPNGAWSDHPGPSGTGLSTTTELGPDWVANIINAVGNATCKSWDDGLQPWQDTVIFVVWDDWGGFYDHIGSPPELPAQYVGGPLGGPNDGCLFPSLWGCGYTYGFRVPFLVVSQYTSPGYVSGDCTLSGGCPNTSPQYYHDFGSILAFIENNFFGPSYIGQINPQYPFADAYFPEQKAGSQYLPLGDFFNLWYGSENSVCTKPNGCPQPFTSITLASGTCEGTPCYGIPYFQNGGDGQAYDPDNDAIDPQN